MPWFKVWNDTVHDLKLHQISYEMDKEFTSILGAWIIVLSIANESPERGKLLVSRMSRVTSRDMSHALNWDDVTTTKFIQCLVHLDMLEDIGDGIYSVTNWDKRQSIGDSTAADRKRRQREREKSPLPSNVTDVTRDMSREMSRDTSISISESESNSDSISSSLTEDDSFSKMRDLLSQLTGLMMTPADVQTINDFVTRGVTEADIRGALQWRKDNNRPAVKTITQLAAGIETNRTMRVQSDSAQGYKKDVVDYTKYVWSRDETEDEEEPEPEPDPNADDPAYQAWLAVKGLLQTEMPKAAYDQQIKPLAWGGFDDGVMTLECVDEDNAKWMASRMIPTIRRQLSGVMNRDVTPVFTY